MMPDLGKRIDFVNSNISKRTDSVEIEGLGYIYKWVDPLPGHKTPTPGSKSPDIGAFRLYELFKGYGIWRSLSRLSKMYVSRDAFDDVLDTYRNYRAEDPSTSKYMDLARAVADSHDLDFDYEKEDYGHILRVWGDDKVEWRLPIRRGKHSPRGSYDRDYHDALGVDDLSETQYMRYNDIKETRLESIDSVIDEIESMADEVDDDSED